MVTQTPWIERKFEFNFPVGQMPNIIERLRGSAIRIRAMIAGLSNDQLKLKIDGRWSILQEIGHLYELDNLHSGRINDFLNGLETLRPADMSNQATEDADYNSYFIDEIVEKFELSHADLIEGFEQFDDLSVSNSALHPRLKIPMRVVDCAFFTAEHDDHHIARIHRTVLLISIR